MRYVWIVVVFFLLIPTAWGQEKLELQPSTTDEQFGKKVKSLTKQTLPMFCGLKYLDLHGTQVTDAGLVHLRKLERLKTLDLSLTKITDAGLVHLKWNMNLNALDLNNTKITDAGLVHLKRIMYRHPARCGNNPGINRLQNRKWMWMERVNLKSLDLSRTQVTDAGLEHLKGLTKLVSLTLLNTKVTSAGVQDLQKALPNCKITR